MDICKENIDIIDEVYNEMKFNIDIFVENNLHGEG